MWVSTLKKRDMFRIRMGFGPAQVSAQDGLQQETGFGSERVRSDRVRADTGFRTGRVLDRNRF
ncbi:hypothetical protein HanIR_Chr07g0302481 [Helianthus annuus]|nr:hypothetical protein HanIR_Chr07g0302481 [Helianthus annuus]